MPTETDAVMREVRDGPFCWAHKAALRRILERFVESNKVPVAISVYIALCFLASDKQTESFQATIAEIASRAGVSYKTALEYLRELEVAGLVKIKRAKVPGTKLAAASAYSLLSVCKSVIPSVCSSDIPLCNRGNQASSTENSEEFKKKSLKEKQNKVPLVLESKVKTPIDAIHRIYQAYPKTTGVEPTASEIKLIERALAEIAKREPDPSEYLLLQVKEYGRFVGGKSPMWIKTLRNYLRDERYLEQHLR